MVTLISVYNSQRCTHRCTARCYQAKGPKCTCCCGSKNHGVGLEKAQASTQGIVEAWLAEHAHEAERIIAGQMALA